MYSFLNKVWSIFGFLIYINDEASDRKDTIEDYHTPPLRLLEVSWNSSSCQKMRIYFNVTYLHMCPSTSGSDALHKKLRSRKESVLCGSCDQARRNLPTKSTKVKLNCWGLQLAKHVVVLGLSWLNVA